MHQWKYTFGTVFQQALQMIPLHALPESKFDTACSTFGERRIRRVPPEFPVADVAVAGVKIKD